MIRTIFATPRLLPCRRRRVALTGIALVMWVSLVGADPLLDPWALGAPEPERIELARSFDRPEIDAWQLEDDRLLNPFE